MYSDLYSSTGVGLMGIQFMYSLFSVGFTPQAPSLPAKEMLVHVIHMSAV